MHDLVKAQFLVFFHKVYITFLLAAKIDNHKNERMNLTYFLLVLFYTKIIEEGQLKLRRSRALKLVPRSFCHAQQSQTLFSHLPLRSDPRTEARATYNNSDSACNCIMLMSRLLDKH